MPARNDSRMSPEITRKVPPIRTAKHRGTEFSFVYTLSVPRSDWNRDGILGFRKRAGNRTKGQFVSNSLLVVTLQYSSFIRSRSLESHLENLGRCVGSFDHGNIAHRQTAEAAKAGMLERIDELLPPVL